MKKIYFILSILFFTQCQNEKVSTSQNENAIVIITTKVKEGMMPDLVKFMDSENVLPVTRSFDGCKSVIQFVNEENNIHVIYEEWDSVESNQKYINYRMNEDKTGTVEKHLTFANGGTEGITFLVNNTNYIYY